jgi:hypothetical protein
MIKRINTDFTRATLYPFAENEQEAAATPSMDVLHNGTVRFDGRTWTRAEVMTYMAQLTTAFSEAFDIAEGI